MTRARRSGKARGIVLISSVVPNGEALSGRAGTAPQPRRTQGMHRYSDSIPKSRKNVTIQANTKGETSGSSECSRRGEPRVYAAKFCGCSRPSYGKKVYRRGRGDFAKSAERIVKAKSANGEI